MPHILLTLFFIFSVFLVEPLFAQSAGRAIDQKIITQSGEYYYGTGTSFNANEARDHALKSLTEQIAVRVASSFEHKLKEDKEGLNSNVMSVLQTHSAATLKNVETKSHPLPSGEIEVFCYLKKSEVARIFEERKKLIAEIAEKALKNERNANISFALKLNYFALLLANSLPEETVVYQNVNYTTEIPARIHRIILNTKFAFVQDEHRSDKEREITVKVSLNGMKASLVDFNFWDGSNQVAVQGRDGLATFHLFGASTNFKELKLHLKYAFYESRNEYNVVADLWDLVSKPTFQSSHTVRLEQSVATKPEPAEKINRADTGKWKIKLATQDTIPAQQEIKQSTATFLDIITAKNFKDLDKHFKADPFLHKKLSDYLKFNHAEIPDKHIDAKLYKTPHGYELRKIRALHRYPTLNKQTTEYLVLDFTEEGKLYDINLSITENLFNEFVKQAKFAKDWQHRQEIIKFIEKYRTAYQTRDISKIDMMFAEDALIIIGREVKRKKLPENMVRYQKFGDQPNIEYLKLKKSEYLARQKRVFKAQKDIFLDFSNFDIIKKNNSKNVYGIEMRQNYASTTYADEGYLFLLIDFNGKDPLIYVRAWQPNEWDEETLIKTANFRIYK